MAQGRIGRSRSMGKGIRADGTIRAGANSLVVLVASLMMAPSFAFAAQDAQDAQATQATSVTQPYQRTTDDYNHRLAALDGNIVQQIPGLSAAEVRADYRIGPDDQLDISVLEAAEFDRSPRVSASGEISLGLVGTVRAAGLTAHELEIVIEELLRQHYIKQPHVSVQIRDVQSHPISVFGAVKKPGVFQVRGPKTVVEMLSMAEGLDVDAGETVIVEHRGDGAAPTSSANPSDPPAITTSTPVALRGESTEPNTNPAASLPAALPAVATTNDAGTVAIDLKKLLGTGDPALNVLVYPGDVVKVPRADLVYVVGEVGKPGGFELKTNESVSVLQAIALAQGLTHTSSSSHSRIIRTNADTGERLQIPIDLNKILAGKIADPVLEPRDIVFVPNSTGRTAFYKGMDAAISIGSGVAIYRP
jgi:polysaccharide biosynthesis/export protein